ncbi:unnamed protein product [Prunus armeniaca]|uniref:Uncharacterized protein n=1 Tax=Prunus armeniaca TaxID=36596 RepID=A0A6J5U4V3_PRUAR|nr:unnamed protein product [Prunus armeniaca]CAB4300816.1 unnamed protein product [Prunus armeniaca]
MGMVLSYSAPNRPVAIPSSVRPRRLASKPVLDSRFFEVGFLVENQALDRHQNLKDRRLRWVPLLLPFSRSGVEQAEADIPARVKVRVGPQPERVVVDLGGVCQVIEGEGDVEEEERVEVGRAGGSDDVDGVREVLLQNLPLLHDLLLDPAAAATAVFVVDVVVV